MGLNAKSVLLNNMVTGAMPSYNNYKAYGNYGYKANADVYAIVNKICNAATGIEWGAFDAKGNELKEGGLVDMLNSPTSLASWYDVIQSYVTNMLVYGNCAFFTERYDAGNNKGQIIKEVGFGVLPFGGIDAVYTGARLTGIRYNNTEIPIDRLLLTKYNNIDGDSFTVTFGQSPIQVAIDIIKTINSGYSTMQQIIDKGMPPGVLTQVDAQNDEALNQKSQLGFLAAWRKKAKTKEPLLGTGDIRWVNMGYSSLKDMDILSTSQHTMRVLCSVYGVSSQLFNDISNSTYNNLNEAGKALYTTRVIPDLKLFAEKFNKTFSAAYNGAYIWPKTEAITALFADRAALADIYIRGFEAGIYTADEAREALGSAVTGLPEYNTLWLNAGKVPASELMLPETEL